MGLFGFSPEKKLQKAQEHLERGRLFDALSDFRAILSRAKDLDPGILAQAQAGERKTRERMIEQRLGEADSLIRAGDLGTAHDRCQMALDLAGDDLPRSPIDERIRQIEAPRRPVSSSEKIADSVPRDLPPSPNLESRGDRRVILEPRREDPAVPELDEAFVFGDDPDALFEIHMNTVDQDTAAAFRAMGPEFARGYLALASAQGPMALRHFDALRWDPLPVDAVVVERVRGLVLAHRYDEALDWYGRLRAPGEGARVLRIEALRGLRRADEALRAAQELVDSLPESNPEADSLLAWLLIEAGKVEDAHALLEGWMHAGEPLPDVMIPAAVASAALGKVDEAIGVLENLIQFALDSAVRSGREPALPVEAARRLLTLYEESNAAPDKIRSLASLLVDFDPAHGEEYRGLLLKLR